MTIKMQAEDIPLLRTCSQQLNSSTLSTVKEVVSWMGAMQAQDFSMSKWAVGIRLPDSTEDKINDALDSGEIIRTHILRPTWHLVSATDIHWMQSLSAPRIKAAARSRHIQLGLTDDIFLKSGKIFKKVLRDNNHCTREELIHAMAKSGILVDENRSYHIFLRAEIDGIICSGKLKDGKSTYALLGERVPEGKNRLKRDEALKELGHRYFTSRGPATIEDFTWWSGLTLKDTRLALELNKRDLVSEVVNNRTYWLNENTLAENNDGKRLYLLPAFDEYIIGYSDRSAVLTQTVNKKVVSNNGIFYPTVIQDGLVTGTWKRSKKNNTVNLTISMFGKAGKTKNNLTPEALNRYSEFIKMKVELTFNE
jgi:hypothetical protein